MMDERQAAIDRLKAIATELQTEKVPRHEFLRTAGIGERKIQKLFGSYNGLVEAAGLTARKFPVAGTPLYDDQQLLEDVVRVLRLPDSKPTRVYFEQNANVSTAVCERRFGGWINTIKRAAELLDPVEEPDLVARIREYTSGPIRVQPPTSANDLASDHPMTGSAAENGEHDGYQFIPGQFANVYGEFINFRGLQHAPVNEQGVVFLFGMICRELGYVVEIVKPGFPDCEAKRRIRGKPGLWQRVRIEFEFQSRNFRSHGHDPDQCDVIVCWEHNWPECPIEVVELRTAMKRLSPAVSTE